MKAQMVRGVALKVDGRVSKQNETEREMVTLLHSSDAKAGERRNGATSLHLHDTRLYGFRSHTDTLHLAYAGCRPFLTHDGVARSDHSAVHGDTMKPCPLQEFQEETGKLQVG